MDESGNDSEYEEQEVLVYVDFNAKMEDEMFSLEKEFKLIGLDSETPVLQISNEVFEGEWKDSMGTHVFFTKVDSPNRADQFFLDAPSSTMKFTCKSDKVLHMSRIFLNPANESVKDAAAPSGATGS